MHTHITHLEKGNKQRQGKHYAICAHGARHTTYLPTLQHSKGSRFHALSLPLYGMEQKTRSSLGGRVSTPFVQFIAC